MGGCASTYTIDDVSDDVTVENSIAAGITKEQLEDLFPSLAGESIGKIIAECHNDLQAAVTRLLEMPMDEGTDLQREGDPDASAPQSGVSDPELADMQRLYGMAKSKETDVRYQAAVILCNLSLSKPLEPGAHRVLARLLDDTEDVALLAATALANAALHEESQDSVGDKDIIGRIRVAFNKHESPRIVEQLARTISNVCYQREDLEKKMLDLKIIDKLFETAILGSENDRVESIAALANLSRNTEVQEFILVTKIMTVREIAPLMQRSNDNETARNVVRFIGNLSVHPMGKQILVEEGVCSPLLYSLTMGEDEIERLSALAIANLASDAQFRAAYLTETVVFDTFIPLLQAVDKPELSKQIGRAMLHVLARASDAFKQRCVQHGLLAAIMPMSRDPDISARILAARILGQLHTIRGLSASW
uniref:CUE domain-containing protein n=1 Tax=Phaeomonas parva TaxID=124430 RepID=A0A7S1UI77_9STRA|mmetsp:Transcript_6476/g.18340  ORF Transcript_6476/g.18340 Transcript_6476/m.18340 type:complete len:422 (+) Transcript_6476:252-1517(+)